VENEQLHKLLEALNEIGHTTPAEKLLPLLEQTRARGLAKEYPYESVYAQSLIALARLKHEKSEALIREAMDAGVQDSGDAWCLLRGVPDAREVVYGVYEKTEYRRLIWPHKVYVNLDALYQIGNGGFDQYFRNSSGDSVPDAIEALEEIGAKQAADVVKQAAALFGEAGPSRQRNARWRQMARFTEEQNGFLNALNKRYYDVDEDIEILRARYVVKHREYFGANSRE
jgi:hypothetical protein